MEKELTFGELCQAIVDGRKIESKLKRELTEWFDCSNLQFGTLNKLEVEFSEYSYRIKSQSEIVPFKFEDYPLFIGKQIFFRGYKETYIITGCYSTGVVCGNINFLYVDLLRKFDFQDGSPCGKSMSV